MPPKPPERHNLRTCTVAGRTTPFANRRLLLATAAMVLAPVDVSAQEYPQRPVRIVVNVSAGGGVDGIARLMAQHYTSVWGQTFIVDNRPGAGGRIGVDTVVKAAPDGHTLLVSSGTVVTNAAVSSHGYDPVTDLQAVTRLITAPYVIAVSPKLPASNLKELLALAASKPGGVSFASAGNGSITHMGAELLASLANVQMLHVPYKGVAEAYPAVSSGQVDWILGNPASVMPLVKAGRLKVLAVTSPTRMSAMPDVPAVAEAGLPGYDVTGWYGMFAPAKTPAAIVSKLQTEARSRLKTAEVARRLEIEVAEAVGNTPSEFAREVKAEFARWRALASKRGIGL
jgi:tripartite-type tricarboxylate transporter receptor subunit TctC